MISGHSSWGGKQSGNITALPINNNERNKIRPARLCFSFMQRMTFQQMEYDKQEIEIIVRLEKNGIEEKELISKIHEGVTRAITEAV